MSLGTYTSHWTGPIGLSYKPCSFISTVVTQLGRMGRDKGSWVRYVKRVKGEREHLQVVSCTKEVVAIITYVLGVKNSVKI